MRPSVDSTTPDAFQPFLRLFKVIRAENYANKLIVEAYFSASHVSEWFVGGRSLRDLLIEALRNPQAHSVIYLPPAEPDWHHYRVPQGYAAIPGDVVGIRATWPATREAAI